MRLHRKSIFPSANKKRIKQINVHKIGYQVIHLIYTHTYMQWAKKKSYAQWGERSMRICVFRFIINRLNEWYSNIYYRLCLSMQINWMIHYNALLCSSKHSCALYLAHCYTNPKINWTFHEYNTYKFMCVHVESYNWCAESIHTHNQIYMYYTIYIIRLIEMSFFSGA